MKYRVTERDLIGGIEDYERIARERLKDENFKIDRIVIIPPAGFNPLLEMHPLENFLLEKSRPYCFKGEFTGKEVVYEVDLRNLELISNPLR